MHMIYIMLFSDRLRFTAPMNWLVALTLMASVAVASASNDLLNERLTTSGLDMEAHWRVDCQSSVKALATPIAHVEKAQREALATALTLCGFIYQPPGEGPGELCPNYAALLQAWRNTDDQALNALLAQSVTCVSTKLQKLESQ